MVRRKKAPSKFQGSPKSWTAAELEVARRLIKAGEGQFFALEDLFRSRSPGAVEIRQTVMLDLHQAGWSTPRIGKAFGVDPSTVNHALRRAREKKERVVKKEEKKGVPLPQWVERLPFSGTEHLVYSRPAGARWEVSVNRYGPPVARMFLVFDGGGVCISEVPLQGGVQGDDDLIKALQIWGDTMIASGEAAAAATFGKS